MRSLEHCQVFISLEDDDNVDEKDNDNNVDDKGLFINDVIIFGEYPQFSLQTTHLLRVHNVLLIHGWSEVKPAQNDDIIYEQPLR